MKGFIYKITNRVNNKVYIGQTRFTIEHRFKLHIKNFNIEHRKQPLYSAFAKYGIENFNIEVLEEVEFDLLNQREKYWIAYYNSFKEGYNATLGGSGTAKYIWTDSQYDEIKSLYLSGFSIKFLCDKFEVSNTTMQGILKSLGIKIRKPLDFNAYELKQVLDEYQKGIGIKSFSRKYHVSEKTMKLFLIEHGVDKLNRYNIVKDISVHLSIINDFLDGITYKNIEEKYHTDTRTIKKILTMHSININAPRGLRQTRKGAFCLTDEQCLEAIKLYNSDVPVKNISKKFNINLSTLYELFKRYNVKCSRYNHSKSVQSL